MNKHKFDLSSISNVPIETVKNFNNQFSTNKSTIQNVLDGIEADDDLQYQWNQFFADELKKIIINQRFTACVFNPVDKF